MKLQFRIKVSVKVKKKCIFSNSIMMILVQIYISRLHNIIMMTHGGTIYNVNYRWAVIT